MKKVIIVLMALTISMAGFAQKSKGKIPEKSSTHLVKYVCPMHPDEVSNKPGKCSKCGMALTKSKKEHMKMEVMKTYSCPMHPGVTSDKPGKCTECGMALTEVKYKSKTKRGL